MTKYKYPLPNAWNSAQERLGQLQKVCDPWTIRNLTTLGVTQGWQCLEIAGGAGSIAEWLCNEVGPNGYVMATDLEPGFLERLPFRNLKAVRHNMLNDDLPQGEFDLAHTRGLLTFLPNPQHALAKMVAAVKPGGWVLIEEPDYASAVPDSSMSPWAIEVSTKAWNALLCALRARGYHTEFGRHLYWDLHSAGLVDVHVDGFVTMQLGGTPSARFWRLTLDQLEQDVLSAGMITAKELEEYRALLESSDYRWVWPAIISARGRRGD